VSKELKYTVQSANNNNSIGSYIQSMKRLEKVGFLLLSEEPLSLQFKAIASDPSFKEKMGFGYYNAGDKDILENFNLKRYPTILTFTTVGDEGQMKTEEQMEGRRRASLQFLELQPPLSQQRRGLRNCFLLRRLGKA
jgi:hypothetical protein